MKEGISFRQYRIIDLTLFAVILLFSQVVITRAATVWYADQLYVVSPAAAVTAIVMMRWGPFAAVFAVLSGLIHSLLLGGGWQQYAVFALGNTFSMAALLFFRVYDKEAVRLSDGRTLALGASVQLLMLLGRALLAIVTGLGTGTALSLITTDILSLVFTLVILWVARRVNGLFEDQKHYLFRIQKEKNASPEPAGDDAPYGGEADLPDLNGRGNPS